MQQQQKNHLLDVVIIDRMWLLLLTVSWQRWIPPSFVLIILSLSFYFGDNIYFNRNALNSEERLSFARWGCSAFSGMATCQRLPRSFPKELKMTLLTANVVHTVYICANYSGCQYKYFTHGLHRMFPFFCLPRLRSAVTRITVFSLSGASPRCEVVWETCTPACKRWFLGQPEGHFTFYWHPAAGWLLLMWGKGNSFSSYPTGWRNYRRKKLRPQFSCRSWQMSLLTGCSECGEVCFSLLTMLSWRLGSQLGEGARSSWMPVSSITSLCTCSGLPTLQRRERDGALMPRVRQIHCAACVFIYQRPLRTCSTPSTQATWSTRSVL